MFLWKVSRAKLPQELWSEFWESDTKSKEIFPKEDVSKVEMSKKLWRNVFAKYAEKWYGRHGMKTHEARVL